MENLETNICRFCTLAGGNHAGGCPKQVIENIVTESSARLPETREKPKPMFHVANMNDVFNAMERREKRWAEEKRVGTVSFDAEFNAVTFHFDETIDKYRYYLYLDRLKTPEDQMRWLNHLRHKNWFTREVLNDFFDCLERLGLVDNHL